MTLLSLTAAVCLAAGPLAAQTPRDGRDVIAMMARRGHIYRTLTFVQTTRFPDRPEETWYESLALPGRLRIDVAPLDSQRVILFRSDSVYASRGGSPFRGRPLVHSLLIMLGDVFVEPADTTAARMTALGFDLGKVREDRWDGRRTWVVGADAGDSTSAQFWIDAERLYMVRMIEPAPGGNGGTADYRIPGHRQVDGVWVESELIFYLNGREQVREVYNDIRINTPLDPAIFGVSENRRPSWIAERP